MANTHYITADIKIQNYISQKIVTQNDSVTFIVRVTDDGSPVSLDNVHTALLTSLRPDRRSILTVGEKTEGNELVFNLVSSSVAVVGRVSAAIQLYDAEGERISTLSFTYEVKKDNGTNYEPDENEKSLIQVVLGDAPFVIEAAQSATEETQQATLNADQVREATEIVRQETEAARLAALESKEAADVSAGNADEKAAFAQEQGDYAKGQGDYAKQEADDAREQKELVQEILGAGPVASVNGKTGIVEGLAEQSAVDEVTRQLAEKVNKEVVDLLSDSKAEKAYVDANLSTLDNKIDNVASGSPKGVYATLTDLQIAYPTGDSNIYVVTADGSWYYWSGSAWVSGGQYQSTGLASNSVDLEHVADDVKNFLPLNTKRGEEYDWKIASLSSAAGTEAVSTIRILSEFIPVESAAVIELTNKTEYKMSIYEYNYIGKTYLGTTGFRTHAYQISEPRYIRILLSYTDDRLMTSGDLDTAPTFLKFGVKQVKGRELEPRSISSLQLGDKSVDVQNTTFVTPSSNLYDTSKSTKGYFASASTGQLVVEQYYTVSDFILIKPNTKYTLLKFNRFALYDRDKNFISGAAFVYDEPYTFTSPSNALFIRVSGLTAQVSTEAQMNEGDALLAYEEYGYKIPKLLLTKNNLSLIQKDKSYYFPADGLSGTQVMKDGSYQDMSLNVLYSAYDSLLAAYPNYITRKELGNDASGIYPLYQYTLKPSAVTNQAGVANKGLPKILWQAAIHGGERPSALSLYYLVKAICDDWESDVLLEYLRWNVEIVFIPVLNPWGYVNMSYTNSNGVNIQRNYPASWVQGMPGDLYGGPSALSEPETQYSKQMMDENKDAFIFCDSHSSANGDSYDDLVYMLIPTGSYYNQSLHSAADSVIRKTTRHFIKTYDLPSDVGNFGYYAMQNSTIGSAVRYASEIGIPGIVSEHFYKLPGEVDRYSSNTVKANTEYLSNLIITLIQQFRKDYSNLI